MLLYVLHVDKPVHCIISVLYVTILIKRDREKERKRNLASQRDRLQGGKPPAPPVAGGNPHAHLNGTVAHAGLPAPLHPATELSHASTELCDTLACRHLRSIDTVYVHI